MDNALKKISVRIRDIDVFGTWENLKKGLFCNGI